MESVSKIVIEGLLTGVAFNSWNNGDTLQIAFSINDGSKRLIRFSKASIMYITVSSGGVETVNKSWT